MLKNVRAFRPKEFRSPWLLPGLLLPLLHRTSGEACAGGAANNMVRFGKFRVESVKTGLKTATATKTL